MHLIIDGKCENLNLLTGIDALSTALTELVSFIGMKPISAPFIVDYPAGNGMDRGLSGCVFLAESSIVIHTYPEYGYTFMDIFSCKNFDSKAAISEVRLKFGMNIGTLKVLHRGLMIEGDIEE